MLRQQIEQQIKEALKGNEQTKLSTLRFLWSFIKNEEIAKQRELSDEEVVALVRRQVKQHQESIDSFEKAGRPELVAKEKAEMEILQSLLPPSLSEEELRKIVEEVRTSLSEDQRNNFGRVMGEVMTRVKGRADGGLVSRIVKETLG